MRYAEGTRPWGVAVALVILVAGGAVLARSRAFDVLTAAADDAVLPDAAAPTATSSKAGDVVAAPFAPSVDASASTR